MLRAFNDVLTFSQSSHTIHTLAAALMQRKLYITRSHIHLIIF